MRLRCALTFATSRVAVDFGANDDTGKYLAGDSASYFAQMAAAGLRQNVMTAEMGSGRPDDDPGPGLPRRRRAGRARRGINVVFARLRAKPTTFTATAATAERVRRLGGAGRAHATRP